MLGSHLLKQGCLSGQTDGGGHRFGNTKFGAGIPIFGLPWWLILVKNLPAMPETWIQSLDWEDPLEEGMATHSSIFSQRIPMARGAWWATVHGVKESETTEQLNTAQTHIPLITLNGGPVSLWSHTLEHVDAFVTQMGGGLSPPGSPRLERRPASSHRHASFILLWSH